MRIDPLLFEDAAASVKSTLEKEFGTLSEDGLPEILEERILKWVLDSQMQLDEKFPFSRQTYDYENCSADLLKGRTTAASLSGDISRCQALGAEAKIFWMEAVNEPDADLVDIQKRLLSLWKDHLERITTEWTLKAIGKRQAELIDCMETWLRFIESAKNTLGAMGIGAGILWDLSEGIEHFQDHQTLLTWADKFRRDPVLKRLCEQLGHEMISSRNDRTEMEMPRSMKYTVVDHTLAEEFSGIETGRRIEDLMPSELGTLDDPELSILFELKYAENRLSCFSKQGYSSVESEVIEKSQAEKDDDGAAGPVILLIDTSGSMTGTPEYIAKGIALFLTMKAHEEKRRCYLINFSTSIDTIDLTPDKGLKPLLDFLEGSFCGGTDIMQPLVKALEMLDQEEYRKADVLTVSDFIVPPDSLDFLSKEIGNEKERKCRFHSLTIGSFPFGPKLPEIFDFSWQYNPATQSVTKLDKR